MASGTDAAPLDAEALRTWRRRLLHGEWRLVDIEFLHLLVAVLGVALALLVSVLVVGMTRHDGDVRVSVLFVAALVVAVILLRGAARTGLRAAERRTAATAARAARQTLLDAVTHGAPMRAGAAATFVARSAADIGEYVARAVPARLVAISVPALVLVVLGIVDPWSALVAGGVALLVPVALVPLGRRAADEAESGLTRLRSLGTRALQLLDGAVELRALGAVERGRDELVAATNRAVASTRRSLRIALRSATALDVLAGAAVGLVAMLDGFRLLAGTMPLGRALAAVLLTAEVIAPLRMAGAAFHAGADGRAAIGALAAAVAAVPARPADAPGARAPNVAADALATAIEADEVALVASPGGRRVVEQLDLAVAAGSALLVTGPTGSGKSTLLRAIAGAPLVADGTLLVGGEDPAALTDRDRSRRIALVDQRPFLVDGTIRENLLLGAPPGADTRVDGAVERCGLASLLSRAPRGLDEPVGDAGRLLSAGERTRIVLARCIVRDPPVLLLDEVGANLDDAAIVVLRASIAGFLAGRTVVEAAHDRPLLVEAPRLQLAALPVAT